MIGGNVAGERYGSGAERLGSLGWRLRLAQNLRQEELAARSHFAQSYISRLERGLRRPSLPRHVYSLAAGLGVAGAEADALYRAAGFLPISDARAAAIMTVRNIKKLRMDFYLI